MAESTSIATLGGGCFWCLDATYRQIDGVLDVVSGYAGGARPNPTYEQVCAGTTGHAEVVQVVFDPAVITYADILELFWVIHDPTTLNRQGNDVGTQYRSVIFVHDDDQRATATASLERARAAWDRRIVTEILPLPAFFPAEAYHQDYFAHHPESGYCQVVINPKVRKVREKFAGRLRAGA